MNPEICFQLLNWGVLPFWSLLVLAPRWRWTQRLVHSAFVPLLFGVAYVASLFAIEHGALTSVQAVSALLSTPWGVVVIWAHAVTLDLFAGAWLARDARRLGLHHAYVVPCLIGTLMYGPAGVVGYLVLRAALRRRFSLDELRVGADDGGEATRTATEVR